MGNRSRLGALTSLGLTVVAPLVLSPTFSAMAAEPTQAQIQTAARLICKALSEGKSPDVARDAARAYLITEVGSRDLLNADNVRQKLRPEVIKQCPGQAMKLIGR
ncbi:hypothetical protein IQ219_09690 [Synechocystis sp. LEGE 06083]|uniref:hypothetical protein n=1 Tax=Synechocystis sp. LEGE 06083 TaxID=915336 RepID=UPI00187E67E5|nr:hypothetical protein [Synechocystis sp. LEGE 06083]MBE9195567.1 hypothetical protein [Synechocystis sp. LEGE 06083]